MSTMTKQELIDMIDEVIFEQSDVVILLDEKNEIKHKNTYDCILNLVSVEEKESDPYISKKVIKSSEIIMLIAQSVYSVFSKIDDFRREFKEKFLESLKYANNTAAKIAFYSKDGNIDKLTDAIIKDMNTENVRQ